MIQFQCKCGKQIKVDDKYAGKTGKCPGCKNIIKIPELKSVNNVDDLMDDFANEPLPTTTIASAESLGRKPLAIQEKQPEAHSINLDEPKKACPMCGEEILETAKKCKHCGEWLIVSEDNALSNRSSSKTSKVKPKKTPTTFIRRIGRIIAISFVTFFATTFSIIAIFIIVERYDLDKIFDKPNAGTQFSSSTPSIKESAWYITQEFIKQYLKSPSTASFGGSRYDVEYQNPEKCVVKMTGENAGENEYVVVGWVDSQNSFGAVVRATFLVMLKHENNGNWTLLKEPIIEQR